MGHFISLKSPQHINVGVTDDMRWAPRGRNVKTKGVQYKEAASEHQNCAVTLHWHGTIYELMHFFGFCEERDYPGEILMLERKGHGTKQNGYGKKDVMATTKSTATLN